MEIRLEQVCKSYGGEPVLKNITFTVKEGVTCIMAPSGAGKTTLLHILLGLEQPDSGRVSGMETCRWSAVFQEDRLLEQLDAMGNLRFVLGAALDERTAEALLGKLGLADVGEKKVRDYSGGMKRRLALCRAMLAPSDAMILDEPFTGLDEENRRRAAECIRTAAKDKPVVLVTHDEADAAGLDAVIQRL